MTSKRVSLRAIISYACTITRCFGQLVRLFFCWMAASIRNPDNIPHYLIALFTFLLVCFAYYAWDESTKGTAALQGQLAVLHQQQRPWIGMGFVAYPPDATQLQFKNAGRSPAFNVSIDAFQWKPKTGADRPVLPTTRCIKDCKLAGFILLPDVPYQFVLARESQDTVVWIIGRADYEDADGKPHKTGVCLVHSPETHDVRDCSIPNSNYAD
jgi:hypothetical protein